MSLKTHFFAFFAPQAPKIRFWGWFWSDFLNQNHRKTIVLLIPLESMSNSRVPKSSHEMDPVGHSPKSIFSPKGWGKLRNGVHPGFVGKISYSILQYVSFFLRLEPKSKKLRGRAVAGDDHAILHKKLLFSTWALFGPIGTSATRSQIV